MNRDIEKLEQTTVESADYYGEDGLLHCGVCHEAKEAYFPEGKTMFGKRVHPRMCLCRRTEQEQMAARAKWLEHERIVSDLRGKCFSDKFMLNWTFENDNQLNPKIEFAEKYVNAWERNESDNNGLLLWGGVGTGKSYMAGCIANALVEQEVSVHMTNFATILNELNAHYGERNEYIQRMCANRLLIIDDLGMERGTEYGLEQVFNVIDARYRSNKPLIVTTNLTLSELKEETDIGKKRIYDRVLSMCRPIQVDGRNLREIERKDKFKRFMDERV